MAIPRLLLGCLLLVAALPARVAAEEPSSPSGPEPGDERPRIGLVLSGGGARGGAHIGVLKALEELRVPLDLIAGTSIGAVVGGFYATGMRIDELENVPRSIDFDAALRNVTPRELRSFRRKRDDDLFLVNQRPGLSDALDFQLPIGFVQGQVIDVILSRTTLPAADVDHFDELAIPFRAVAADIVSGDAVVLESGNLARALRASMSLPAAITPLEIDGRLLVDGGIAMNLPVEVAIEMGADVVIAVDITTPMRTREELRSVLDISFQLSNLLTRDGVEEQKAHLRSQDILLSPEFSAQLSPVSYARMSDTIAAGYDLVMAERELFEPFSMAAEEYAEYRAGQTLPTVEEPPTLDFVRLNNASRISDEVILARMRDVQIGEPFDVDVVERAINKIYGMDFYQNVRYDLVTEDGLTGLEVDLEPRSWGPNYLQLGMGYSASGDDSVLFGLAVSYLRTAINERGAELRTTIKIGDEPAWLTDLYRPLGRDGRYFFAPALNFSSTQLSLREGGIPIGQAQLREALLELGAGRELNHWGEIRVGLRSAYGDTRLKVGDPALLPSGEFRRGQLFARFSADTLDSIAFPRSGVLAALEWRGSRRNALSADENFDQVLLRASHARTWGRHTLLSTFRYDETVSGEAPLQGLSRLGGFIDLSGLNHLALSGQHSMRIGANYYRRIGDLSLFPAFAGVSVEVGNVWDNRSDIGLRDTITGGSLWAGVDTPVGPIYVGYGRTERGDDAFYVFLGNIF